MNAIESQFQGTYLLVDAAGPLVQTGLWRDGTWTAWTGSRDEAGRSVFTGVSALFAEQRMSLPDLSGFFFCEGPGSMLGIRIAAMAIHGWQSLLAKPIPVFTYNSHAMLAAILLKRPVTPPFHVISDARRNRWNVTSIAESGAIEPIQRLPNEAVAALTAPLYRMEEVIRNEPPRPVTELVPYNLENQAERFLDPGLLRQETNPDVLVQEVPDYKKWTAERHR